MRRWFVVYTKPKKEVLAGENLRRQGYEIYCPLIRERRYYRGAWHETVEPIFPRYLFVHLEQGQDNFAPIRSTRGMVDFVHFGGTPKSISEELITEIKAREESELGMIIKSIQWKQGTEVEFVEGPFIGCRGIFNARSGKERVNILLRMLGKESLIVIEQDSIVPVE